MRAIRDVLPRARTTWLLLVVLDALAVVVPGLLVLDPVEPGPLLVATVTAVLVCRAAGLHRHRLVLSVLDDLGALALAALGATLALVAASSMRPGSSGGVLDVDALRAALVLALSIFATTVLLRTALNAVTHVLRSSGPLARPTLVVGAGTTGRRIAETLLARRELGLRPVGMVDGGHGTVLRGLPLPLVGQVEDLDAVVDALEVDDVVFAYTDAPDAETLDAVRGVLRRGRQVYVVPRFFELVGTDLDHHREQVRDVALVRLVPRRRTGVVLRALDAVVAAGALVVLAPVLVVVAVAVKVETRASVLVRRPVTTPSGRAASVLRFRTLRPPVFGDVATSWSLDHDRRTGPVGRLLRRTALDELPQLLDVVHGDRSLLGGRVSRRGSDDAPSYGDLPGAGTRPAPAPPVTPVAEPNPGPVAPAPPAQAPGPGAPAVQPAAHEEEPRRPEEGWAWLVPAPFPRLAQRREETSRR